ncbi:DNA-binding HxlR family transcriptional regulator [Mycobacterium sp. MAA66]|uniref:winged helix-turn-helix transcriptional regulator n=1 Tax=Mycobacterium sp. MAA66 TaxID=3156297 RepID=UPI0035166621
MADHRPANRNPGAAAVELIGERWNYLILREVFFGVRRFGQLQRALGIAPNILTSRLTVLADAGFITKHRYRVDPDWYEYHLSDHARDAVPALLSLAQWAEEHLGDEPVVRALRHTSCGQLTTPVLICNCCREPLRARDLQPETISRESKSTPDEVNATLAPDKTPGRRKGT